MNYLVSTLHQFFSLPFSLQGTSTSKFWQKRFHHNGQKPWYLLHPIQPIPPPPSRDGLVCPPPTPQFISQLYSCGTDILHPFTLLPYEDLVLCPLYILQGGEMYPFLRFSKTGTLLPMRYIFTSLIPKNGQVSLSKNYRNPKKNCFSRNMQKSSFHFKEQSSKENSKLHF